MDLQYRRFGDVGVGVDGGDGGGGGGVVVVGGGRGHPPKKKKKKRKIPPPPCRSGEFHSAWLPMATDWFAPTNAHNPDVPRKKSPFFALSLSLSRFFVGPSISFFFTEDEGRCQRP